MDPFSDTKAKISRLFDQCMADLETFHDQWPDIKFTMDRENSHQHNVMESIASYFLRYSGYEWRILDVIGGGKPIVLVGQKVSC